MNIKERAELGLIKHQEHRQTITRLEAALAKEKAKVLDLSAAIATEKRKTLELQRVYDERGLQIGRLELCIKRAALAQKEAAVHDSGATCVYCAVAIDGAAPGDLHAAIVGIRTSPPERFKTMARLGYGVGSHDALCAAADLVSAALAQPVAVDAPACKCTFRGKILGDGCDVCNPELAERFANERAEDDAIDAQDGEAT